MSELRRLDSRPTRRLLIAGGGNIGRKLARTLEKRYQVKVLERSRERARSIAEELLNSIVLVVSEIGRNTAGNEANKTMEGSQ